MIRIEAALRILRIILSLVAVSFLFFFCLPALYHLGYPGISHLGSRERLTMKESGINCEFRQLREPTKEERLAGIEAMHRWRSANSSEKSYLADDIVLSKVLLGKTQKEIVSEMGKPDAFAALSEVGPHIRHTGYSALHHESQCDLMIDLDDNGRTKDVYLDVNY